jgi:hypothetical protein
MSANLDVVRSIHAEWKRGESRRVDWARTEIEFVRDIESDPDRTEGIVGMASAWRRWLDAWQDFRPVEVDLRIRARGKAGGVEVEESFANLCELREGRVARRVLYEDRDRALADLSLVE